VSQAAGDAVTLHRPTLEALAEVLREAGSGIADLRAINPRATLSEAKAYRGGWEACIEAIDDIAKALSPSPTASTRVADQDTSEVRVSTVNPPHPYVPPERLPGDVCQHPTPLGVCGERRDAKVHQK
jgi:hypothetical protein